jgi:glycosyltransferase involved in cell wall biosynthesis
MTHDKRMNILFDGAIFDMQRFGGISRYFSALFDNLPEEANASVLLPYATESDRLSQNHRISEVPINAIPVPKILRRATRWIDQLKTQRADDGIQADIIHWTYYIGLHKRPVKRSRNRRQVVTVYDLIHEKFPEMDPKGKEVRWKKSAIAQADLLICISETTRNDLIEWYPECASRAIAIPLGNPIEGVSPCGLPETLTSKPFVLFVGKRGGYKNFCVMAKAWLKLKQHGCDLQMVLVGDRMGQAELKHWGLCRFETDLHCMGHVDDSLLASLYKNSAAFVFPSRYEGFGLPAIEAMSCGTLLLSSGAGALSEVAGDGGLEFDPDNEDQLADLIRYAVEGGEYIEKVKKKGIDRAKLYNWKSMASRTYKAYRDSVC